MPFPFWPFRRDKNITPASPARSPIAQPKHPANAPAVYEEVGNLPPTGQYGLDIRRHFYNEPRFQCYASFFRHWDGWITAGHCLTDAQDLIPPFTKGEIISWPDGLDAALIGTRLPKSAPPAPKIGQRILAYGYPAGSRHLEIRKGHIYIERGMGSGQWIAHIEQPDEPVVTGMSGGAVLDADSKTPLGIIITRNSPTDLNRDDDPDESFDFIALSNVWAAVKRNQNIS